MEKIVRWGDGDEEPALNRATMKTAAWMTSVAHMPLLDAHATTPALKLCLHWHMLGCSASSWLIRLAFKLEPTQLIRQGSLMN
jgi:hypothetical protein